VTISGTNFVPGARVSFGANAATGVLVMNATNIICLTPPGAQGAVDVTITNPDTQSAKLASAFRYGGSAPTITNVNPASGPAVGGTVVTVTGTNFAAGAAVSFGANAATGITVSSATSITCTTPPGAAGAAGVTVTNLDTQSVTLPTAFTYVATPVITWANPAAITYGTTLSGTQLNATASVPGAFVYTPAFGVGLPQAARHYR